MKLHFKDCAWMGYNALGIPVIAQHWDGTFYRRHYLFFWKWVKG